VKRIRIAQIGIGHDHAAGIFADMAGMPDLFEIAGWYVPEEEKTAFAGNMTALQGYPELTLEAILEDPSIQAVTVETEEKNLCRFALLAAKRGKHVHMDKPGGMDPQEFETLVQEAKRQGTVLHLGYMYRYYPAVQELLQLAQDGEYGRLLSVEGQMNCWHNPEKRRWIAGLPGGMMFFLGCHMLDLVVQFMGMPLRVTPLNQRTGRDGVDAADYAMALLHYPSGPSLIKACDTEKGGFGRRQLVLCFERCTVELKPMELLFADGDVEATVTVFKNGVKVPGVSRTLRWHGRSEPMMRGFAAIAAGEKENPWTPDYELRLYELLRQCCSETDA